MENIDEGTLSRRRLLGRFGGLGLGLIGLTAWPPATAAVRSQAPDLLLARDAAADIDPAGFLVSEKLDGVRAFWDGSALRFRSGLTAAAPRWFLRRLPAQALDGELWLGRGRFEALAGAVRRLVPRDAEWQGISYRIFELPGAAGDFAQRARLMRALAARVGWPQLVAVDQRTIADRASLRRWLDEVVDAGGEGLMLHRADASYHGGRSGALVKLKPLHDAEAVVIAHVPGKGKYHGQMGALQVRGARGITFLIGTGFDDALRAAPPAVGSTVTYTHRGHTANGVPRFASFLRVRTEL